jgi:hypothetical protein
VLPITASHTLQMDSAAASGCSLVVNTLEQRLVYWHIKEAIATLSPIVRNRLHGIPAYILDYADLIVSNQVEKPFLKPVLLTGPCTDEKWDFLQTLTDEFPDVFAFPKIYTDEPGSRPADPYTGKCVLVLARFGPVGCMRQGKKRFERRCHCGGSLRYAAMRCGAGGRRQLASVLDRRW